MNGHIGIFFLFQPYYKKRVDLNRMNMTSFFTEFICEGTITRANFQYFIRCFWMQARYYLCNVIGVPEKILTPFFPKWMRLALFLIGGDISYYLLIS